MSLDPTQTMTLRAFRELPVSQRLSLKEEQGVSEAKAAFMALVCREYPHYELLRVPIAPENNAEVRVSAWPKSVREFDVLLSAIKACRSAFLRAGRK